MTKAEALRVLVASLADDDDDPKDPAEIAAILSIPVARVDAILDSLDPPHGLTVAPAIEPLERTPKTRGKLLVDRRWSVDLTSTRDICGQLRGYWKHRKLREPPCRPCLTAYNDHQANRKAGVIPNGKPVKPINHGTPAGRAQERRRGIPVCDECRAAFNADKARRKRERRTEGRVVIP